MATNIYPALGNGLNRFFLTSGIPRPEPRMYQCKHTKDSYDCVKHMPGMLVDSETKIVEIPNCVPEVFDRMYLWGIMAKTDVCLRPTH